MKISTRQYAKKQISWIRNKLMPAVKEANAQADTVSLYLLDAAGQLPDSPLNAVKADC
jgi:tRNA dimethylallyltransferase